MERELIPMAFIRGLAPISWTEVLYGYVHQWLGWKSAVELGVAALEQAADDEHTPLCLVELAAVEKETAGRVGELLECLARDESSPSEDKVKGKWLFIRLSWLYENRHNVDDPLGKVEEILADFSYPKDALNLLRFMPPQDGYRPQDHTREANTERLFNNWRAYLDDKRTLYGPSARVSHVSEKP